MSRYLDVELTLSSCSKNSSTPAFSLGTIGRTSVQKENVARNEEKLTRNFSDCKNITEGERERVCIRIKVSCSKSVRDRAIFIAVRTSCGCFNPRENLLTCI